MYVCQDHFDVLPPPFRIKAHRLACNISNGFQKCLYLCNSEEKCIFRTKAWKVLCLLEIRISTGSGLTPLTVPSSFILHIIHVNSQLTFFSPGGFSILLLHYLACDNYTLQWTIYCPSQRFSHCPVTSTIHFNITPTHLKSYPLSYPVTQGIVALSFASHLV